MKLQEVLQGLDFTTDPAPGVLSAEVTDVCQDSRLFRPGAIFVAIRGEKYDGHDFIAEAQAQGAAAVVAQKNAVPCLTQSPLPAPSPSTVLPTAADAKAPLILVSDTRVALDKLAANYFGHPSAKLFVVGVTGTNGKTTTTNMIEAILNQGQILTGVIGTIDAHLGENRTPTTHTTPDALNLQRQLAQWYDEGAKAVSMEVSSHALALNRVESLEFDVAAFTNLTRDHLDFHQTMENYLQAKAWLFRGLLRRSKKPLKRAVLNGEDPHWQALKPDDISVWTYGFASGDIQVKNLKLSFDGTEFGVRSPAGDFDVTMPMIGRHNVANGLCAIGVGLHAGVSPHAISGGLNSLAGVAGRLQRVPSTSGVRVFVDYAHTDDALINVLSFLRELRDQTSPASKITTVFGCGGDRDRGKRPLMLAAARRFSDAVIVTSDNPRTEEPERIIRDIIDGAPHGEKHGLDIEVDRRRAITLAVTRAKAGDVILIAGKGHENYQIIGTKKIPFDDATIAKEILGR